MPIASSSAVSVVAHRGVFAVAVAVAVVFGFGCAASPDEGIAGPGDTGPPGPSGMVRLVGTGPQHGGSAGRGAAATGPSLQYFGGRVVSNVQVVQVLYGAGNYLPEVTSTATPSISTFYQQVTNSELFDWIREYNTATGGPHGNQVIGRGSLLGQFQITPAATNNGTTITDANIQAELRRQLGAGLLPAPTNDGQGNNNTYYAIFFPHGKKIVGRDGSRSCETNGFCGYHGTIANVSGHEAYYGVHADMQVGSGCELGCGGGGAPFPMYQTVASHELIETVTDPDAGLTTTINSQNGWIDPSSGEEIGDLCNGQQGPFVGADGQTYTVQREFSNVANGCVVIRPPRGPAPLYLYFNGTYHFYTAYFGELGNGAGGYTLESIVGFVYLDPIAGHQPLYRYVSSRFGAHFYTTFFGELGYGLDGWKFEGIAGYMPTSGANTTPFYRYVDVVNGDHYYTANFNVLGNGVGDYQLEQIQSLIYSNP
ncbi:MAG TPA: hypothetical protein VF469_19415 [Kofleriaceae bacterium]